MRLVLCVAAAFSVVAGSDLAKPTRCANECSQRTQLAQASAFCSSYENTVVTSTYYPYVVNNPVKCCSKCCRQCGTYAPPTTTPQTTPAPTCLGTAYSSACACLSLTRSTTTVTYSSTVTMNGPFYAAVDSVLHASDTGYLTKVDNAGNVELEVLRTKGNPVGDATELWVDHLGRLFDSNPPTVPFSISNASTDYGAFPMQVNNPSSATAENVPLTCLIATPGCNLRCIAPGPPPDQADNPALQCKPGDTWFQSYGDPAHRGGIPPNCTSIEIFARPAQNYQS